MSIFLLLPIQNTYTVKFGVVWVKPDAADTAGAAAKLLLMSEDRLLSSR